MSEIALEQKNTELKDALQEALKQQKSHSKIITDLNKKITQIQKEILTKSKFSEKFKKDLKTKLDRARAELKKKELEQKKKDLDYEDLSLAMARLEAKFEAQRAQLNQIKQQLAAKEQAFENSRKNSEQSALQVAELTKDVTVLKRNNEELQKALTKEKKMSRLFVKERDVQNQAQIAKIEESSKELVKQKHIISSLTAALGHKITECRTQKEAMKVMKLKYEKKNLEITAKMSELEKKEQELQNKQCEYCGF